MRSVVIALFFLSCALLYNFYFSPIKLPKLPRLTAQPQAQRVAPNAAPPVDPHAIIQSAARKHKVPAAFVKSIVAAESNFNPGAVSARGAVGLMQLMPSTAQEYGANPSIPEQNVDAGTRYLGWLLKRYAKYRNGLARAIAAYNAGPAVVDRFRGIPPYHETRNYVTRVLAYLRQFQKEAGTKQTAEALRVAATSRSAAD